MGLFGSKSDDNSKDVFSRLGKKVSLQAQSAESLLQISLRQSLIMRAKL